MCLILFLFFNLLWGFAWSTFRFYKANSHFPWVWKVFFCLNYSPFLRVCLSHFTIKVYASVNSPHHVGFGEGLFLTAFCCVRARQLCSVEFFSVDIEDCTSPTTKPQKCVLNRGNMGRLIFDRACDKSLNGYRNTWGTWICTIFLAYRPTRNWCVPSRGIK